MPWKCSPYIQVSDVLCCKPIPIISECSNVSIKFLCALLVYLCFHPENFSFFSVSVSPFYSYFCVNSNFFLMNYPSCHLTHCFQFVTWHLIKLMATFFQYCSDKLQKFHIFKMVKFFMSSYRERKALCYKSWKI